MKKIIKFLNLISIILILTTIGCNNPNINSLSHEKIAFNDLPNEIIRCIENPNEFKEQRNNMLIELPKGYEVNYKLESVKTLVGPWTSHFKLIKVSDNKYYKIDRGIPGPYFILSNKLYVPNRYNIFTTADDLSTVEFTRYDLN